MRNMTSRSDARTDFNHQAGGDEPSFPDPVFDREDGLPSPPPAEGRSILERASGRTTAANTLADEVHITDYLRVIYKRRWTATAAFVAIFGALVVYTFTATPIYEARAQLLIENENPNVVSFQEVMEQNKTTADYYQTQYRLLQSRSLAKRTMDAERFWNHPMFAPKPDDGFSLRAWVSGFFGGEEREAPGAEETATQSRSIDAFLRGLTVTPVKNSRLVDISYSSRDPELASRAANAHAKAFIEQNLEFRFTQTQEATEFLTRQMAEQRKAVEAGEVALQTYREQNDAVSLEDRQNIVVQRLADLNAAVTKARTERIEKQAVYNQIRAVQQDRSALDTIPGILSNTFIQELKVELASLQRQEAQLSDKLGERHPEMIKVRSAIQTTQLKLEAEVNKVVMATRTEYMTALDRERSLTAALEQQKTEALALNRSGIQYGALQRDAAASRQLYEGLLQRTKETDIAGELKTSNIRVTDRAETPRVPAKPNKRNNLLLGLFLGTFVAFGVTFLFEYLDSRIKSPEELKNHLGLPFLGLVPIQRGKVSGPITLTSPGVPHDFAEAFRGLRTNVVFGFPADGPKSLVITSTGPGEGKTSVSVNLALSLAMTGQRVLLIDADMRRPTAHDVLGLEQEPGLSNLIVGNSKAAETLKRTSTPTLWFLPAGKIPPNPAELLASRRCLEFLRSLRDHFDWVIIDSPPVMAVADAAILAHHSTAVLFVVGAEMTGRGPAKSALDQLDGANAKYLGAVLNKVELTRHAYYYSRYYRRDYATSYAPRHAQ